MVGEPRARLGQDCSGSSAAASACRDASGAWKIVVDRPLLDLAAEIHDHDVVGHLGDHAHVVGDQDDGEAALAPAAADQVEDLRLGGDVERGGRLVGDQDARVGGERHARS